MYGFKDYADALQRWFVGMSVTPEGAGRKYQNRRAMPLHHLLETYRLTGKTDLFDRFKADYFRVADEIVSNRHSTTDEASALLPPDNPSSTFHSSPLPPHLPHPTITPRQLPSHFPPSRVPT